jgi:hypothetical protein
MIRAALASLVLVLVAAVAPAARAQGDDPKAAAEMYFRAGESAYVSGQYLVAAQAFEEAYARLPLPAIAFSTAQAYRLAYVTDKQAAYVQRAVELYRAYVEEQREGARVPDAIASLAELEPVLERLTREGRSLVMPARAPRTELIINSQVPGARATVAGRSGPVPLTVEVEPGEHVVLGEADGYFPAESRALAVEGRFLVHEVVLQPMPARLELRAEAGARVTIDGRRVGTTPLGAGVEVPAGRHYVAVTRRGRRPYAREIEVARGDTLVIDAPLRATGQRRAVPWVWGGAGLLAVAAGGTGVWALREQGRAAALDERRRHETINSEELARYLEHRERRDTAARATWVLGGAAAATAAVGLLLYVFDRPEADAPPPREGPAGPGGPSWSPFAGAGAAGLSVAGRF